MSSPPYKPRRRFSLSSREAIWAYIFLLVPLGFFLFFRLWPAVQSFKLSFFSWHVDPEMRTFVGLKYYREMYAEFLARGPIFKALRNMLFYFLLVPGRSSTGTRYALAGFALAGAMFIKYTTAPLLLVFPLVILLRREWRRLPFTLIPWLLIAAWSFWNLHEYGHVHLLDREAGDPSIRGVFVRVLGLLTAIGAVSPFTLVFLRALVPKHGGWIFPAWVAAIAAALVLCIAAYTGMIPEVTSDQILRITFTLNGLLVAAYCIRYLPRNLATSAADRWALAAWAAGLAFFLAGFSPMMATRHVLLIIPAVLLLIAPALNTAPIREKILAVVCTAALGVLLTVSDKEYAGFYREQAPRIAREMEARTTGTVWSLGHWGWQWYSEQAGMSIYGQDESRLEAGDILVIPEDYDAQVLTPGIEKVPIATWDGPPGPGTFFCVEQFASMYTSSYGKLPWSLSRSHHKIIKAYRVTAVH